MIQFDEHIFQLRWNHQPDTHTHGFGGFVDFYIAVRTQKVDHTTEPRHELSFVGDMFNMRVTKPKALNVLSIWKPMNYNEIKAFFLTKARSCACTFRATKKHPQEIASHSAGRRWIATKTPWQTGALGFWLAEIRFGWGVWKDCKCHNWPMLGAKKVHSRNLP